MLDNFTGEGVKIAAKSLREKWKGKREFLIEISGGIREDNVFDYANNGEFLGLHNPLCKTVSPTNGVTLDIDIISTSSIHQGTPHVDFSLKIDQGKATES